MSVAMNWPQVKPWLRIYTAMQVSGLGTHVYPLVILTLIALQGRSCGIPSIFVSNQVFSRLGLRVIRSSRLAI